MMHAPINIDPRIDRARSVRIEDECARRGIKLTGKNDRVGPCPKCGGDNRFSIDIKKQVFNCRGCKKGGDVIDLVQHLDDVDFPTALTTLSGEPRPKTNSHAQVHNTAVGREGIAARFDYNDESGNLLFQVRRIEYEMPDGSFILKDGKHKKTFRQKRPDPAKPDAWINNVDGVRTVPYRLPELIEAIALGHPILIVEGEGKVDLLLTWNVPATCCAQGADQWKAAHSEFLRGADVVILPDNDQKGRDHADVVGASLQGIALSVRILELPGLPPKGDIVDWANSGGTVEQLYELIARDARPWKPAPAPPPEQPIGGDQQPEPDDGEQPNSKSQRIPLLWIDLSKWDGVPVPRRKWAIRDRVPLNQAGLFSGEGGTGKSILEITKDVAHVTGKDWLGSMPEPGPAFYLGAEDGEDELHIRIAAIAAHYGTTFKELADGGLHVMCLLGKDATLCAPTHSGKVETTGLYKLIYEAAGDIKPKNISIDTLSRAFAGNEIDRVQVYAFADHMQALAMVASGSVTVLAHPSLSGIASGSGISGSTAWHGAFRFRQYLKGVRSEPGEQPDDDLRELEFKKNQYGPRGESVVVRYRNGLFLPEHGMSNLDKVSREAKAADIFLDLLKRLAGEGRNVSDKLNSPTYAPATFAKEDEAKKAKMKKADFETAMRQLFANGKIHVETYGKPSRQTSRLAAR